ncbi:MAG: hypothetical protein V3T77_08590, partial [Planctomycetota bacterium]
IALEADLAKRPESESQQLASVQEVIDMVLAINSQKEEIVATSGANEIGLRLCSFGGSVTCYSDGALLQDASRSRKERIAITQDWTVVEDQ